jgi:hypothetical protein
MGEDTQLFTVRREREMTRTHAILWGVVLVATVLDVVTTILGLERGLTEGNVVVGWLVETLGLPGLWLVKFGAMVWLVGGWVLLSDRNASIFLGLFATVTVATVVSNVFALLSIT